ncbi:MAG: hypothetical protein WCO05_03825 [Candidatus Moraniibacteriota bacterium]|jgi:hypothetical protein
MNEINFNNQQDNSKKVSAERVIFYAILGFILGFTLPIFLTYVLRIKFSEEMRTTLNPPFIILPYFLAICGAIIGYFHKKEITKKAENQTTHLLIFTGKTILYILSAIILLVLAIFIFLSLVFIIKGSVT